MTLVPVDTTNAVAVTDYLTKARNWLSTAVEKSTPLGIAGAKVEIAVAAEATKQLGLSKEIQDEAAEMVRRAEYTLRKAVTKAQEAGEIVSREDNLIRGNSRNAPSDISRATPSEFFSGPAEHRDANAMGALEPHQFEAVLHEAKAEGNLSRANVARKAREATGSPSAPKRKALTDTARDAGWDLRRAVERLERIAADDRFDAHKDQMATHLRGHLNQAIEVCQGLLNRINNT